MHSYAQFCYTAVMWGGFQTQGVANIDKVFFWYIRCVLKSTTSNIIVVGECGQIPPSVSGHIKAICYLNRLQNLTPNMIVKQTYSELSRLHNCGFSTWVTKVFDLAQKYDIDLNTNRGFKLKQYCKNKVINHYKNYWWSELQNVEKNPILKNYNMYKLEFGMEKYIDLVTHTRHRTAITRLRTSSHTLEIERGRYTVPRTPINDRLCCVCKLVEDEAHFLLICVQYKDLRKSFYEKVSYRYNYFTALSDQEKYKFLMMNDDPYILAWLGKYICHLFTERCETMHSIAWCTECLS